MTLYILIFLSSSGIMNDLGSGSHVDICVITGTGIRRWRERLVTKVYTEKQESINTREKSSVKVRETITVTTDDERRHALGTTPPVTSTIHVEHCASFIRAYTDMFCYMTA